MKKVNLFTIAMASLVGLASCGGAPAPKEPTCKSTMELLCQKVLGIQDPVKSKDYYKERGDSYSASKDNILLDGTLEDPYTPILNEYIKGFETITYLSQSVAPTFVKDDEDEYSFARYTQKDVEENAIWVEISVEESETYTGAGVLDISVFRDPYHDGWVSNATLKELLKLKVEPNVPVPTLKAETEVSYRSRFSEMVGEIIVVDAEGENVAKAYGDALDASGLWNWEGSESGMEMFSDAGNNIFMMIDGEDATTDEQGKPVPAYTEWYFVNYAYYKQEAGNPGSASVIAEAIKAAANADGWAFEVYEQEDEDDGTMLYFVQDSYINLVGDTYKAAYAEIKQYIPEYFIAYTEPEFDSAGNVVDDDDCRGLYIYTDGKTFGYILSCEVFQSSKPAKTESGEEVYPYVYGFLVYSIM